MTPTRYRECLDFLGLSQRGLGADPAMLGPVDALLGGGP